MPNRRRRRQFGNIRRLPSKRWQARFTAPTGEVVTAPRTFAARIDAEAWLADRRREIDAKAWNPASAARPERITFGAYAERWLCERQVSGQSLKPRTRQFYRRILDTHLLPTFADRQLAAITPADVRAWHAATLVDKPTTRAHAYSLLRTILSTAVNEELINASPCRIPGAGSAQRVHKVRPATVDELEALAQAMPPRLSLMVTLASWCALRFGEIIELRRSDIDLQDQLVRIRRAAARVDGTHVVDSPKSRAGFRDVAIPPHLIGQVCDHLAYFVGLEPDSLLFPAKDGGHLPMSTLYDHWCNARAKVGREDLRFHDLRHSGAVLAAGAGATLAELMARLGHSSPRAALIYLHAADGRDREIAALLSKLADNRQL